MKPVSLIAGLAIAALIVLAEREASAPMRQAHAGAHAISKGVKS